MDTKPVDTIEYLFNKLRHDKPSFTGFVLVNFVGGSLANAIIKENISAPELQKQCRANAESMEVRQTV
jgi:hypothetical protein